jgi:hypothetical protein
MQKAPTLHKRTIVANSEPGFVPVLIQEDVSLV